MVGLGLAVLLFSALVLTLPDVPENTSSMKIFTFPGETVVLPLRLQITTDLPTVEWSKKGLKRYVIVFRGNRESEDLQDPVFRGRTSLFTEELKGGNLSLTISAVQEADAGTYRCKLLQNRGKDEENVEFELVMGVVSEPTLTFVQADDGQVTLQCEARCWFPAPDITFHDDQGKEIRAKEQKNEPRSGKCCSVTRRVALQKVTDRVSCQVHQKETKQMRHTEMFIPAKCMLCTCPCTCTVVAVSVAVFVVAAVVAVVITCACGSSCQRQRGHKPVDSREASSRSTNLGELNAEFINRLNAEKEDMQKTIDRLTKENNELMAKRSLDMWESDSISSGRDPQPASPTETLPLDPLRSQSPQRPAQSMDKPQPPSSPAAAEKPLAQTMSLSLPRPNTVKTRRTASMSEGLEFPNNNGVNNPTVNRPESGSSRPSRDPQPASPTGTPPLDPVGPQRPRRPQRSQRPAQLMDNRPHSPSSPAAAEKLLVHTMSLSLPRPNTVKTRRTASISEGLQFPNNSDVNSSRPSRDPQPASPTGTPPLDPLSHQRPGGSQRPPRPAKPMDNIAGSQSSPTAAGKLPARTMSLSLPRSKIQRTGSTSSNRYSLLEGLHEDSE